MYSYRKWAATSAEVLALLICAVGHATAQTQVTLSVSSNPARYGQPVTLTATVNQSSATGAVTFFQGANILGTSLLNSGTAPLITSNLSAGSSAITAVYASAFGTGVVSNAVGVQVNTQPDGSYQNAAVPQPVPQTSTVGLASAVADLNHDGIPDLVVVGASQVVSYLGNGDGTFTESWIATGSGTGGGQPAIAVADFNLDGNPDLLVNNESLSQPLLFTGNGDGTFSATPISEPWPNVMTLAAGDMNGDGIPDAVIVSGTDSAQVSIELGTGTGSFTSSATSSVSDYGLTYSIVIGDFNLDGKPDIAISGADQDVGIFFGNGDGTIHSAHYFDTPGFTNQIVKGDFDGDGRPDIAVLQYTYGSQPAQLVSYGITVLLSELEFSPIPSAIPILVPAGTQYLVTGDFNGDGKLDLAASGPGPDGSSSPFVSFFWGNGDGTFEPALTYQLNASYLSIGDFNNDGRTDVVGLLGGSPGTVTVTASASSISLTQTVTLTASVAPADLSGQVLFYNGATLLGSAPIIGATATLTTKIPNTDLQYVTAVIQAANFVPTGSTPIPLTVSPGAATSFANAVNYTVGTSPTTVVAADFNGDGKLDLAVGSTVDGSVYLLFGNGAGGFSSPVPVGTYATLESIGAGDFNGDGIADLAISTDNGTTVLVSSPAGTLTQTASGLGVPVVFVPRTTTILDVNRDGKLDLVISQKLFIGNGDGTFLAVENEDLWSVSTYPGDFNGDGIADLYQLGGDVALGNGNGGFTYDDETGGFANAAAFADFNGDGKLDAADLTSFPESPGAVVIKLGNGDGTFTSLNPILFPQMAAAIAAGDFNGDGKPDLVISEFSNGVGILYGNGDGTFQVSPTNFVTGTGPSSIAVGDFNGDGLLDLAVTNTGNGTVSALLGVNTACGVTAAANAAVFDNNGGNCWLTRVPSATGSEPVQKRTEGNNEPSLRAECISWQQRLHAAKPP